MLINHRYVKENQKYFFLLKLRTASSVISCIPDHLQELGELASRYDICLHVDLCLGGFVLPFARKLGYLLTS
jgi:hypothetical protein